jgi:hypothetical protein
MKVCHIRRADAVTRICFAVCLSGGLAMGMLAGSADEASAHAAPPIGQAKKALLVLSDMPDGWTSTRSSNNNSSFPGATQLADCLGVPTSVITDNPPTANSPEFASKNQLQTVNDSVSIYPSVKAARTDFASLANVKTPSCLTQVLNGSARPALQSQFGSGVSIGNILVSRSPVREFAPGSANFTAFMPITTHAVTLNLELTVVDYVKAREEQTVTLISVQSPFPSSLARHLTTVAAGRL